VARFFLFLSSSVSLSHSLTLTLTLVFLLATSSKPTTMAIASIFQSHKKRPSLEISINKRWSASSASIDSPTSRVRQRFSSILHGRKASITTLETMDSASEPRYSSSSDRSSLQQPPTPPPHTPQTLFEEEEEMMPSSFNLARQVRCVLGTALDEVDEEIELEWEDHRHKLRQSLQLPKRPVSYM
ncbi:hypothetical protein BDB00DRAFT_250049, partial [Zychaea mexicana]|uniref:uncharacterized protein n=1 Tax=Zychaea mexicana TaxID=64656 RepID=UPI0022FE291E